MVRVFGLAAKLAKKEGFPVKDRKECSNFVLFIGS